MKWRDDYGLRPWAGAVVLVGIIVGVMMVVTVGALLLVRETCRNTAEEMGRAYHWRVVGGCYLQTRDGEFVPEGILRRTEESR